MLGIFLEYETQRIYDALQDFELQRSGQENEEISYKDQAAPSMTRIFLKLVFALAALGTCVLPG